MVKIKSKKRRGERMEDQISTGSVGAKARSLSRGKK